MKRHQIKIVRRARRQTGIRKRVMGTPARPRLCVFRSLRHMYAQVIDDLSGRTIVAASTKDSGAVAGGGNRDAAIAVGKRLADRAREAGVGAVVFDRGGYRYHGRVKALADAAREGGLKF